MASAGYNGRVILAFSPEANDWGKYIAELMNSFVSVLYCQRKGIFSDILKPGGKPGRGFNQAILAPIKKAINTVIKINVFFLFI